MNGCVYLMPTISKHLQLSWKALQSWQKLHIRHDGGPVGLETLALIEEYLRGRPDDQSQVAADMLPVAVDGYMREQDLLQVQVRDIVDNPAEDCLVFLFGRATRGESSKTGRDQGVQLDDPYARAVVRRRIKNKQPKDKVFNITESRFGQLWKEAANVVTGDHRLVGPPHSLRHTGASRDRAAGLRTIEEIKQRGRWKVMASVTRYAKIHAWVEACKKQSPEIKAAGGRILDLRQASVIGRRKSRALDQRLVEPFPPPLKDPISRRSTARVRGTHFLVRDPFFGYRCGSGTQKSTVRRGALALEAGGPPTASAGWHTCHYYCIFGSSGGGVFYYNISQ